MTSVPNRPKLRKVERIKHSDGDFILRDPLDVADAVRVPAQAMAILDLLDGHRTVAQIRQSLRMRANIDLDGDDVEAFIQDLDDGGWLEGDAFQSRWAEQLQRFLDRPTRLPRFAGLLYPQSPDQLRDHLRTHVPSVSRVQSEATTQGVLIPNSPVELIGSILDVTLRDLPRGDDLDLIVVLATDLGPGRLPFAISPKPYATPLGTTPHPSQTLAALERRVPWIYREAIRHRQSSSTELAAVLLQYVYGDTLPPVLFVLCNAEIVRSPEHPNTQQFLAALESVTDERPVLWWGTAELSHAGPAYGYPPLTPGERQAVIERDHACLDAMRGANAQRLSARCREESQQGRPSGGGVMMAMNHLLADARAQIVTYERKRAPGPDDGEIGMAGVRFNRATRRMHPI